jgi:photosystem II stability/assembly factor-like uncharacterized protein
MDPQDNDFLYIGTRGNGMLYSDDGGASWRQPRYSTLQSDTIYSVEVDPTDVCTVYVARGQRLYRTTDCMRSFDSETYVETRSGVNVVQIAVDWYDNNIIWIGLSNGDVLKSEDFGETWQTSKKIGKEISEMLVSSSDSRSLLVSTYSSGIYKTTDQGETWEGIEGNIKDLKDADEVYDVIQSADAGVIIATTTYGLLKSTDFGSTWEPIDLITSSGQVTIRAVGIDIDNPDTIYYAANSTFYRSFDGGSTWDTERLGSSRVPRVMLVDPEDSSVLYVGVASAIE